MAKEVTDRELQKARLLALILPAAEREQLERDYGVRPALLSAVVGFFELWLGVAIYGLGHPGLGGAFGWVLWHLNPITWLGLLTTATGLMRTINYFANRDSIGEPLVWLFLRLYQGYKSVTDAPRLRKKHGSPRPDRIVRDADGALVLIASREKPDWDEHATVRIEDEFYRIVDTEERRVGPYIAFAYMLEPQPESENFLGLVHTTARLPPFRKPEPGPEDGSETRGKKA